MECLIIITFIEIPVFNAKKVGPDQMPHSEVSDLGAHHLARSLLWDAGISGLISWKIVKSKQAQSNGHEMTNEPHHENIGLKRFANRKD